jgi:hypothetical protein
MKQLNTETTDDTENTKKMFTLSSFIQPISGALVRLGVFQC